jgi:hypothetical protein
MASTGGRVVAEPITSKQIDDLVAQVKDRDDKGALLTEILGNLKYTMYMVEQGKPVPVESVVFLQAVCVSLKKYVNGDLK